MSATLYMTNPYGDTYEYSAFEILPLTLNAPGTYTFNYVVQDGDGEYSLDNYQTVEVINQAPVPVFEITQISDDRWYFFTQDSYDPDGYIVEHSIEFTGPNGEYIVKTESGNFEIQLETAGVWNILYGVKDNEGSWSDYLQGQLSVNVHNNLPLANYEVSYNILNKTIEIISLSTDSDGEIVSHRVDLFENSELATYFFTENEFSIPVLENRIYDLNIIAEDNDGGASSPFDIQIKTEVPNQIPEAEFEITKVSEFEFELKVISSSDSDGVVEHFTVTLVSPTGNITEQNFSTNSFDLNISAEEGEWYIYTYAIDDKGQKSLEVTFTVFSGIEPDYIFNYPQSVNYLVGHGSKNFSVYLTGEKADQFKVRLAENIQVFGQNSATIEILLDEEKYVTPDSLTFEILNSIGEIVDSYSTEVVKFHPRLISEFLSDGSKNFIINNTGSALNGAEVKFTDSPLVGSRIKIYDYTKDELTGFLIETENENSYNLVPPENMSILVSNSEQFFSGSSQKFMNETFISLRNSSITENYRFCPGLFGSTYFSEIIFFSQNEILKNNSEDIVSKEVFVKEFNFNGVQISKEVERLNIDGEWKLVEIEEVESAFKKVKLALNNYSSDKTLKKIILLSRQTFLTLEGSSDKSIAMANKRIKDVVLANSFLISRKQIGTVLGTLLHENSHLAYQDKFRCKQNYVNDLTKLGVNESRAEYETLRSIDIKRINKITKKPYFVEYIKETLTSTPNKVYYYLDFLNHFEEHSFDFSNEQPWYNLARNGWKYLIFPIHEQFSNINLVDSTYVNNFSSSNFNRSSIFEVLVNIGYTEEYYAKEQQKILIDYISPYTYMGKLKASYYDYNGFYDIENDRTFSKVSSRFSLPNLFSSKVFELDIENVEILSDDQFELYLDKVNSSGVDSTIYEEDFYVSMFNELGMVLYERNLAVGSEVEPMLISKQHLDSVGYNRVFVVVSKMSQFTESSNEYSFSINGKYIADCNLDGEEDDPAILNSGYGIVGINSNISTNLIVENGARVCGATILSNFGRVTGSVIIEDNVTVGTSLNSDLIEEYNGLCEDFSFISEPVDPELDQGLLVRRDYSIIENSKFCDRGSEAVELQTIYIEAYNGSFEDGQRVGTIKNSYLNGRVYIRSGYFNEARINGEVFISGTVLDNSLTPSKNITGLLPIHLTNSRIYNTGLNSGRFIDDFSAPQATLSIFAATLNNSGRSGYDVVGAVGIKGQHITNSYFDGRKFIFNSNTDDFNNMRTLGSGYISNSSFSGILLIALGSDEKVSGAYVSNASGTSVSNSIISSSFRGTGSGFFYIANKIPDSSGYSGNATGKYIRAECFSDENGDCDWRYVSKPISGYIRTSPVPGDEIYNIEIVDYNESGEFL